MRKCPDLDSLQFMDRIGDDDFYGYGFRLPHEDGEEDKTIFGLRPAMARFKLEIVRSECIGCELCSQTCPELFQMASDGLSSLPAGHRVGDNDEQELDDEKCSRQACDECPVTCIHLYENGSKLI